MTTLDKLCSHYEIHACKAGIANSDLDGDYLNSGSVNDFSFILHVFRDATKATLAIFIENLNGQSHWVVCDEPFWALMNLFPPISADPSNRSFKDLAIIALQPELLESLFDINWIVERVGEDYGGEVNMTGLDDELAANFRTGPSLAVFSTFAECEIALDSNAPPDLSEFYPDYIDKAEAVRLYLGPPW